MGQPQAKKLQIPSVLAAVATVQKAVICDVDACGHAAEMRFAIRLALDEALANAIHHGNGDDSSKTVTIEYRVTPDRVEVSVCDEGTGFDPGQVPDPTLPENLVKPRGRGIMLMKAYVGSVRFNKRGNCVTLTARPGRSDPPRYGQEAS